MMTSREPLFTALGAVLSVPLAHTVVPLPAWQADDATRQALRAPDEHLLHRLEMISTGGDGGIRCYGSATCVWAPDRLPMLAACSAVLFEDQPFEQILRQYVPSLRSRLTFYADHEYTQVRYRLLLGDDGPTVAEIYEQLHTHDSVHLAPTAVPRVQPTGLWAEFYR